MIEIEEDKISGLSEHVEEALKHIGKAMHCISEMGEESSRYADTRSRRSHSRVYDDYDDEDRAYHTGRYSRY